MTAPFAPVPITPGPSGNARAGSLSGFTNLKTDLDANFAAFRTWATRMQTLMTPVTQGTTANWIQAGTGWSFNSPNVYNVARRIGRLVQITIVATYTGSVTSDANGDIATDLTIATITETAYRPWFSVFATGEGHAGFLGAYSILIGFDGIIKLTGLSAALTATNPGFALTASYFGWPNESIGGP